MTVVKLTTKQRRMEVRPHGEKRTMGGNDVVLILHVLVCDWWVFSYSCSIGDQQMVQKTSFGCGKELIGASVDWFSHIKTMPMERPY